MWRIRHVNRSHLFRFAASRTRASACDTASRLSVRTVLCCPAVSSAPPLPSTASAPGRPGLFGRFPGTMDRSDFPGPCISGFQPKPSRRGLAIACQAAHGSPGSRVDGVPACMGPRTARGRRAARHGGARRVAFRFSLQRRHPGLSEFCGSIPSPQFPLSTLRRGPHGRRRMTRGRRGRLRLRLTTLSFASIHRSPGAQRMLDSGRHRCSDRNRIPTLSGPPAGSSSYPRVGNFILPELFCARQW